MFEILLLVYILMLLEKG